MITNVLFDNISRIQNRISNIYGIKILDVFEYLIRYNTHKSAAGEIFADLDV